MHGTQWTHKRLRLIFPDGLVIPGFERSILGWYMRRFPASGIPGQGDNALRYTAQAAVQAQIHIEPDPALKFVAVDRRILRGPDHVATASSGNFAQRIARALNYYKANGRGQ